MAPENSPTSLFAGPLNTARIFRSTLFAAAIPEKADLFRRFSFRAPERSESVSSEAGGAAASCKASTITASAGADPPRIASSIRILRGLSRESRWALPENHLPPHLPPQRGARQRCGSSVSACARDRAEESSVATTERSKGRSRRRNRAQRLPPAEIAQPERLQPRAADPLALDLRESLPEPRPTTRSPRANGIPLLLNSKMESATRWT